MQPQGTQEFKTASQLKIETAEMKKIVDQLADHMKLRQWCIEQAAKNCGQDVENTKTMAQMHYDFITKIPDSDE